MDEQVPAYPVRVFTAVPTVAADRPGPIPSTGQGPGSLAHRAGPPPTEVGDPELPEQVPAALVDGFRQRYGVDVAAVPVWRGAAATEVVQQAGARAATRGGEVLLPASAGPLDAPPARALLAHELAHVVQQRAFGATPPAESTGTGRDLEARALAAEHAFGDGGGPGVGGPLPPAALLTGAGAASTPAGAAGTWGITPGGGLTWQAKPGAGGVPPAALTGPPAAPTGPPAAAHPLQRASMDTSAATLDDLRALVRGELDQQQDQAADPPAGPPSDALRPGPQRPRRPRSTAARAGSPRYATRWSGSGPSCARWPTGGGPLPPGWTRRPIGCRTGRRAGRSTWRTPTTWRNWPAACTGGYAGGSGRSCWSTGSAAGG
ncbi:DUF4157 domain-containing protein [Micromonospora sp. CA-248260]|uniref:eCIS core domain-containing protein n=1 Tax=Micromonospora sp. CA-248260 TaxID=3239962 RepID=UPI003D9383FA